MATATTTEPVPSKKPMKVTPTMLRKRIADLEEQLAKFEESGYCYMCGKFKPKKQFYRSTDPLVSSGITPICSKCASRLALRVDANGELHEPTKESIQLALRYLDKPFLEILYNSSVQEASNKSAGKIKANVWTAYIKNVSMPQYNGLTYKDSDMFKEHILYDDEKTVEQLIESRPGQDTYADYLKNKRDVIRLLNYDPFEKESISDQPLLYSQLLGMIDSNEEGNDDMMRIASSITIVRGFLQQSKIDDSIVAMMQDHEHIRRNSATIKSLEDSKGRLSSIIKDLAAESCISLKNTKNAKKGENTWTGKIKKIKDLNLREAEINGFDLDTCRGMQQVMDLSNASILRQLRLDESEYSDMLAEQREMITSLQTELSAQKEVARILLRENVDLKDLLQEHGISISQNLVDLNDLFSPLAELEEEEEMEVADS